MDNQEDKIKYLRDLARHPGWILLKLDIEARLSLKRKQLEVCMDYQLDKYQGEIKGLKFALEKVEQVIKGEKTDGKI